MFALKGDLWTVPVAYGSYWRSEDAVAIRDPLPLVRGFEAERIVLRAVRMKPAIFAVSPAGYFNFRPSEIAPKKRKKTE